MEFHVPLKKITEYSWETKKVSCLIQFNLDMMKKVEM